MADALKPVGKAVALAKGHYPNAEGRHLTLLPGQTFTVWEGRTKASWFKLVEAGQPAPAVEKAPEKVPEPETLAAAATVERKRKSAVKASTEVDIV